MLTTYTHDEEEVLRAGLRSDQERSEVWKRHPSIVEDFINRGLIKTTDTNYADGHVERIPLSLSDMGLKEATALIRGTEA